MRAANEQELLLGLQDNAKIIRSPMISIPPQDDPFKNSDQSMNSCYESDDEDASANEGQRHFEVRKQINEVKAVADEKTATIHCSIQGELIPQGEGTHAAQMAERSLFVQKIIAPATLESTSPLPLIRTGYSLLPDIKDGWRPHVEQIAGAPIPLFYDYEVFDPPTNPVTGKPYRPLYLGPRLPNSIEVHKAYAVKSEQQQANLPIKIYDCGANSVESDLQPYSFKFPRRVPRMKQEEQEMPREFVGMNPELNQADELVFDSHFESGNLDMVIKTNDYEYDLYMRVDTNTRGHHQWFYFTVSYPSTFNKKTVSFTVRNFTKDSSLYNYGMRIAIAKKSEDYVWQKAGDEILYKRSNLVRRYDPDPAKVQYYYQMSFKYTFRNKAGNDTVCFAYCYPYTFSKLTRFLKEVGVQQKDRDIYQQTVLCKSISGIDVPLCTITSRLVSEPKGYNLIKLSDFDETDSRLSMPLYKRKKYVIIMARVHPGESNGSFMMQGLIKFLCGDSHSAKELRKRIVFKIIPMSNPDGVIAGNYRTCMCGHDLNRRYHEPDFRLHPTVVAIKQLTNELVFPKNADSEDVLLLVDMHGHSRKKNTFVYGPEVPLHHEKYYKIRIIPRLIADETSKFRYFSCKFRHERSKLKAARIVMWKQFNISNCYTYESSMHGFFDENNQNYEFDCSSYEEMGEHLVNGIYEYLMIIEEDERRRRLKDLEKRKKKKLKQQLEMKAALAVKEAKEKAEQSNVESPIKRTDTIRRKLIAQISTTREKSANVLNTENDQTKAKRVKKKNTNSKNGTSLAVNQVTEPDYPNGQDPENNPNEPPCDSRITSASPGLLPQQKIKKIRNLQEMFNQIKNEEGDKVSSAEESSDGAGESVDDNLDKEQENQLMNAIFQTLNRFAKLNNLSETEYQNNQIRIPKKVKRKPKPEAIVPIPETKKEELMEKVKIKVQKTINRRQKQMIQQNLNQPNYATNTLSIQQKRKSFTLLQPDALNIMYGLPSADESNDGLKAQDKSPIGGIVSNALPGDQSDFQNSSLMRKHPGIMFSTDAVQQHELQQQRTQQALIKPTYIQPSPLQPNTFNFSTQLQPFEDARHKIHHIKIGRIKKSNSNFDQVSKIIQAKKFYPNKPTQRKHSQEKLYKITEPQDEDLHSQQSYDRSQTEIKRPNGYYETYLDPHLGAAPPRFLLDSERSDLNQSILGKSQKALSQKMNLNATNGDSVFPPVRQSTQNVKNTAYYNQTEHYEHSTEMKSWKKLDKSKQGKHISENIVAPGFQDLFIDQLVNPTQTAQDAKRQTFQASSHLHNFNLRRSVNQKQERDRNIFVQNVDTSNSQIDINHRIRIGSDDPDVQGFTTIPGRYFDDFSKDREGESSRVEFGDVQSQQQFRWGQLPYVEQTHRTRLQIDDDKQDPYKQMHGNSNGYIMPKVARNNPQSLFNNSQIQMVQGFIREQDNANLTILRSSASFDNQYEAKMSEALLNAPDQKTNAPSYSNLSKQTNQSIPITKLLNRNGSTINRAQTMIKTQQKQHYMPYSFNKTGLNSPILSPHTSPRVKNPIAQIYSTGNDFAMDQVKSQAQQMRGSNVGYVRVPFELKKAEGVSGQDNSVRLTGLASAEHSISKKVEKIEKKVSVTKANRTEVKARRGSSKQRTVKYKELTKNPTIIINQERAHVFRQNEVLSPTQMVQSKYNAQIQDNSGAVDVQQRKTMSNNKN